MVTTTQALESLVRDHARIPALWLRRHAPHWSAADVDDAAQEAWILVLNWGARQKIRNFPATLNLAARFVLLRTLREARLEAERLKDFGVCGWGGWLSKCTRCGTYCEVEGHTVCAKCHRKALTSKPCRYCGRPSKPGALLCSAHRARRARGASEEQMRAPIREHSSCNVL